MVCIGQQKLDPVGRGFAFLVLSHVSADWSGARMGKKIFLTRESTRFVETVPMTKATASVTTLYSLRKSKNSLITMDSLYQCSEYIDTIRS